MWALGCIIYHLIAGRPPFRAPSDFLVFQKVSAGDYKYPNGFPESPKNLIDQLLVLDPQKRLGATSFPALKVHPFFKDINWDTIHSALPPPLKANPAKMVFEEDLIAEEEMKRKRMIEEEGNKWKKFLEPDEVILETGLVWKRKGRSIKKRQLILTNKPKMIYVDAKKMALKGEVPWSVHIRPEAKNNTAWFIHTPKRTYILEDIPGNAHRWIDAINKQLEIYIRQNK